MIGWKTSDLDIQFRAEIKDLERRLREPLANDSEATRGVLTAAGPSKLKNCCRDRDQRRCAGRSVSVYFICAVLPNISSCIDAISFGFRARSIEPRVSPQ